MKYSFKYFLVPILLLTGLRTYSYPKPAFSHITYSREASQRVDSLKALLASALAKKDNTIDTLTINRINELAKEFIDVNPDSALYYGKMAIEKSIAIKYNRGIADGLLQTASVYVKKSDYTIAQKNLNEAKLLYIRLKNDKGLSDAYIILGRMYEITADYNLASIFLKQALDIKKRIKDEPGIAECYHSMGILSDDIGKSSFALDNYFKSLALDIKLHDNLKAASNYNDIGAVMQSMEIYPKSLEYYKRALKIWQESNNLQGVSVGYTNIGEILMVEKKYDEAIVYLSKAMQLTKTQDDKNGISLLYADIGLCYGNKKQYKQALAYLNQAIQIANRYDIDAAKAYAYIDLATVYNMQSDYENALKYASLGKTLSAKLGSLNFRTNAALQLSEALGGLQRFEEAFKAQKEYYELKDSLKNDESVEKLTSFNLESSFAEKQRQLVEQHKQMDDLYHQKIQRQGLLSAIFFVIIMGMTAVLAVHYRSKRRQQKINIILEDRNHEVLQQKTDLDDQALKLNELNNLKDRLISVLAHDLRAPLSTLRGLFSLLEDDSITHEQFLAMIPQALRKLEYTSDFLDTLLFWINSQMENFENSVKNFAVKDVVAYEIQSYHEQAASKGITLTDNVPEHLAASADENSIRIVIRNLITNAIKFSRQNDTIDVYGWLQDDDFIVISIKDTGVGMSEKQVNKLFKSKVDSGTGTNNESGTGMGLLFCKDLIEKCNGKIWVESKYGKGTEFFFTVPVGTLKEQEAQLVS